MDKNETPHLFKPLPTTVPTYIPFEQMGWNSRMQLHLGCIADDFFFFLKKVEVQEREGLVHLVRISIKGSVGETHPRELKKKVGK